MAQDLVPSGDDGSLVVSVDSRKAIAGLNDLESRMYGFVRGVENQFNKVAQSTSKFAQAIQNMSGAVGKLIGAIGGFIALRQIFQMVEGFISKMIEVNRVFTGFIASMSIIRGSVDGATKEYKFLLDMSNKLGVSVETSISQYHRLAAALKNVDKDGELARNIFSGISQAAVVLHSRGRDVTLIFEAVQQMASKGKLSLEELQRQLGNTLPGAMGIAARAMMKSEEFVKAGVKTAAESEQMLRKGIQKGTINVYEFLARLANQLKTEYGAGVKYASDQFTANFNRMKNSVFEFYRMVGSSNAMQGLTELIREITALFNDSQGQGAAGLGQALGGAFKDMAKWVSQLDSTDVQEFFEAVSVSVKSTFIILSEFMGAFSGIGGVEMETPLLDFVEFVAKTMAALVDVFRVAIAGIEMVIRGFMDLFYSLREAVMGAGDLVVGGAEMMHNATGIGDMSRLQEYKDMRAGQQATRDANAAAFKRAGSTFLFGPEQTTYDKVGAAFDASRNKLLANKYGVTGQMDFTVPGVPAQQDTSGWTMFGPNIPEYLRAPGAGKAGSSADSAAKYVNPLGDYELQQYIDKLRESSNAPNGPKEPKGKRDPVQNNFLREQTRLLKDISVAENEYQNVLANRNLKEGEATAQMRSLITTDERYVKLSDDKKAKLIGWAEQLDRANKKVEDAIKAQGAYNDALMAEADVRSRVNELAQTGYESKYRNQTDVMASFGQGGENQFMDDENKRRMIEASIKQDNAQRILDMARYAAEIHLANDEMRFQADLIGKGKFEQMRMTEERKIDLMVQQMSVGATAEQTAEYKRMAEVLKNDVGSAIDYLKQKQDDLWGGIHAGIQGYIDATSDWAENMNQITTNALGGIEDAFVSMVETGKLSFADLTRSIAKDLVRLIVRYLLVWFLQKMTGLGGGGGGDMSGMQNMSAVGSQGFTGPPSYNGNVFRNGMIVPFAKGGVFDQPAMFAMGGRVGTAFEKNAEAIMPLVRDSSGSLGVKAVGNTADGGGETWVNLKVEVYQGEGSGVKTSKGKSDQGDVLKIFIGEVAADIQRGGPVAKAMTQTFGVKRSPKSYS